MASSSETVPGSTFEQRVQRHERIPRVDLPEDAALGLLGKGAAGGGVSAGGLANPSPYTRFIPREELAELGQVSAWVPGSFDAPAAGRLGATGKTSPGTSHPSHGSRGAGPARRGDRPAAPSAAEIQARREAEALQQAQQLRQQQMQRFKDEAFERGRNQGIEEGKRIARREHEKTLQIWEQQIRREAGSSIAEVLVRFQDGLQTLEQALAQRIAGIALQMARQVVRHELKTSADITVQVTKEALGDVLLSARHIVARVHPDDFERVEHGCVDLFQARGARLVADARVERGGCLVESDLGVVDARIGSRWAAAMSGMGVPMEVPDLAVEEAWDVVQEARPDTSAAPVVPTLPLTPAAAPVSAVAPASATGLTPHSPPRLQP